LNFVGAYAFFFAEDDVDPAGLWLAGSLTSALFYGAASLTGIGRWYPVPAVAALLSALGAALYLADAPPEAYPAAYMVFAFLLTAPATLRLGRAGEVFGTTGQLAAHAIVPAAFVSAAYIAGVASSENGNEVLQVKTLWFLPPTLGLAAAFYLAMSFAALPPLGRWSPHAAVAALFATLTSVLALSDAPVEAYPGSYIAFACLLAAPATLRLGKVADVLGPTWAVAAHAIVPAGVIAALYVAGAASGGERSEATISLATRWYLPPTLGLAAAFYWTQGDWVRRVVPEVAPVVTVTALVATGAAGVSVLFGMDAEPAWYGVAIAVVGWLYAAGSEGFGPRWTGQRYLGWLALVTISSSWVLLEGLYSDQPRIGAGVHFSAALFYLGAARVVTGAIDLLALEAPRQEESEEPQQVLALPAAAPFIYATGLTVALGYYYLLASLPAAEGAEASDLGLPFFYLSLGVIAVAVSLRWLWPEMRVHAYAVSIALSLFVLLSSVEAEGRVTLLLTAYGAIAFVIALWEREALALVLPAAYGFFALLAAWRYYTPDDAYLPLIISLVGCALYAVHLALREQEGARSWSTMLLALAFAYAVLAPVVGWIRLSQLADPGGFVGAQSFEATGLYQTSAAAVAMIGLLVGAEAWLRRRIDMAVAASALLMVALLLQIGHYRPENVQAYTLPLGAYILSGALLGLRVRDLPGDLRDLLGPLEAVGAGLIMGPSLAESFDAGAWRYGVFVLAEGLAFVSLALVQRRVWLLGAATGFIVLDAVHYVVRAGVPPVPTWAILAMAGIAVMAAGTAILFGRDRWTDWQRTIIAWWNRDTLAPSAK
jgi:hypothetical protein